MTGQQQSGARATHLINDHQHRIVAARFDLPADWQAESRVIWNFQHYTQPLQVWGRVFHPSGNIQIEFFPVEQFCWIEPNLGFHQPGKDLGDGTYFLPPMSAADTLTRWIIPKYRGNRASMNLVGIAPAPYLPQIMKLENAMGGTLESVTAKIEYQEGGRRFAEEFYGVKIAFPGIPTYGAAGCLTQFNWGFVKLVGFRAQDGQLDPCRETFWSIIRSLQVNPLWEQLCARIMQQLKEQFDQYIKAGYANIEAASRLSKQISANNDAWLQQQAQQREAAYESDRRRRAADQADGSYTANDAFGDYIMGRETYNDPYYQGGSQHSGYHQYVWTDSQGNYQYSDDANFDPNLGSNRSWTLMEKKQIG